jgi:hypothetical protein
MFTQAPSKREKCTTDLIKILFYGLSNTCTGLDKPSGFKEVEAFHDIRHI